MTYFGVEEEYHNPKLMRLLCEHMKNVLLDHTTGDCSLCRHWVLSKHALMEDLKVHTEENALKYFFLKFIAVNLVRAVPCVMGC